MWPSPWQRWWRQGRNYGPPANDDLPAAGRGTDRLRQAARGKQGGNVATVPRSRACSGGGRGARLVFRAGEDKSWPVRRALHRRQGLKTLLETQHLGSLGGPGKDGGLLGSRRQTSRLQRAVAVACVRVQTSQCLAPRDGWWLFARIWCSCALLRYPQ